MPRELTVPRAPKKQPDPSSTQVGQKRFALTGEYDPQAINAELDSLHERINLLVNKISSTAGQAAALAALPENADLKTVLARLNAITVILAGLSPAG